MQKKLTITLDERVYEGLHSVIGRGNISQFIQSLIRSHVVDENLESAYREMAQDHEREAEAQQWAESTIGDANEAGRSVVGEFRSQPRRRNPKAKARRDRQQ